MISVFKNIVVNPASATKTEAANSKISEYVLSYKMSKAS